MAENFYHCTYYHFTSDTIHRAMPCMKIMKRLFSLQQAAKKETLSAAEAKFSFCLKLFFADVVRWAFRMRINLIKSTKLTFLVAFLLFFLPSFCAVLEWKVFYTKYFMHKWNGMETFEFKRIKSFFSFVVKALIGHFTKWRHLSFFSHHFWFHKNLSVIAFQLLSIS